MGRMVRAVEDMAEKSTDVEGAALLISLNSIDAVAVQASVTATVIEGAVISEWWRAQDKVFTTRVVLAVREGLAQGLTNQNISKNLRRNVFPGSRAQINTLIQTSTIAVAMAGRQRMFEANQDVIRGKQQVSTLDGRTSPVCISYSGHSWELDNTPIAGSLPFNGGPPRHFNCRSSLIPILRSFEELGLPKHKFPVGTRASVDGQVPADISFNSFLRSKSKTFQDGLLGPAKARLWRSNKITLRQLVDMRGNPLTVAELQVLAKKSRRG